MSTWQVFEPPPLSDAVFTPAELREFNAELAREYRQHELDCADCPDLAAFWADEATRCEDLARV